jgi:hypothetical protein
MFAKTQLVYDNTSPADGDVVGSKTLAADGTAITATGSSLDVNVTSAINVSVDHANDSIKVGDGTDFLAVNNDGSINVVATATNLDIRDLVFATDKVDVSGSTVAVTQSTSPWVVSATNLDIRDLVFATDKVDASGSAVSITGTVAVTQSTSPWVVSATNLDIRDLAFATDSVTAHQGGSWTVTANDAALANTAILNTQKDVSTTGALLASQQANRKYLYVQNLGNKKCYIGASGVTTGTGIEMGPQTLAELRIGPAVSLHAVASSGTQDFRIMELS